jgi:hypothetical protein
MKFFSRFAAVAVMLFSVAAFSQNKTGQTLSAPDAFAALRNLAGEWSGTVTEKDTGPAAGVNYKVMSEGKVVVETLFPGTAHEMITMYYLKGDKIMLTHYCASGNHPQMALDKQSTKNLLVFSFTGAMNFDPAKDMHMHNGRIKIIDNDHIESEWDAYQDGKQVSTNKFFLARKKS